MRLSAPGILVFTLGLCAPAIARAEDDHCKQVDAPIITQLYTVGCTSPVGFCTRGTVGAGPLEGTTQFQVVTLGPGPTPETMIYTGILTITTRGGSVTIHDRGILNTATGQFFELDPIVAGTGKFREVTGLLTSQGLFTGTGFIGTLTGAVCKGGDDERGHGKQDADQDGHEKE